MLILGRIYLCECRESFGCPPLPPLAHPAATVYELKPQDIKVVMALGDSVTAGSLTDNWGGWGVVFLGGGGSTHE